MALPADPAGPTPQALRAAAFRARAEQVRRAAARQDVLAWGRLLFPDKFPIPFCAPLHGHFVRVRGAKLTSTEAPRFHAKTTIQCFLIPIFQALVEPETFRHYLNVQSTDRKALSINTSIRVELERNELLRAVYAEQIGRDKWTDQQFVLRNGTIFTAVGAGQSIRGINYENVRPDYIVVDDLYDEEDIHNPESTQRKNEWVWGTLYPTLAVGRRTSFHLQGTAINTYDLLEQLKGRAGVESASFKAIVDEGARAVLWPEGKSFAELAEMRENMGTVIFDREMQNERREAATAIIKRGWVQEYDPAELVFDRALRLRRVLLCVDPSIGKDSEADATGIVLVLHASYDGGRGSAYYVAQVWNEHLSVDARLRQLQRIADEQPPKQRVTKVRIEGVAGFKDFVELVRRQTDLPVEEVDQTRDKISNLENKSHFFENGKVFVNRKIEARLKDMLIHQLTTNHPKHDDLRDALLLALDNAPAAPSITVFDND